MRASHVITAEEDFLVAEDLDAGTARSDDAFWARYARLPVTPQRLLNWWVARRWVMPRDVRKH